MTVNKLTNDTTGLGEEEEEEKNDRKNNARDATQILARDATLISIASILSLNTGELN